MRHFRRSRHSRPRQRQAIVTATELIIALFLSMSCTMASIDQTVLSKETFQVTTYRCVTHTFKVWQRFCKEGQGFYSRPFLIEETHSGQGFYLNRFGEIMAGQNVSMDTVYVPSCGA